MTTDTIKNDMSEHKKENVLPRPASNGVNLEVVTTPVAPAPKTSSPTRPNKVGSPDRGGFKKNERRTPRRESRVKPEFDQKIISIRRVTRVVTGGRRFAFRVAIVAGNRKGSVGVGQ